MKKILIVVIITISILNGHLICLGQTKDSSKSPIDHLVGIWGVEQTVTPILHGELTIDCRNQICKANIDGFEVTFSKQKDTIQFIFPSKIGEFRGAINPKMEIIGHWIQPRTVSPYDSRYASPVTLKQIQKNVWRGIVSSLETDISFYIKIDKETDNKYIAFIKNQEANYYNRRTYNVEIKDGRIFFNNPNVPEEAQYDRESDALISPLLNNYPPLKLTRRTQANALHFTPRLDNSNYSYQIPIEENDGWKTASMESVQIDKTIIERFINNILKTEPAIDNPMNIHSLLIARHGKLVLEEYFYGNSRDRSHDMRSASKTIAPILIGIAKDKGYPIDANSSVYSFFPEYKPFKNWDNRKSNMKVKDLMNMASGLDIDDSDPKSLGNEGTLFSQKEDTDLYRYTLNLPMKNDPNDKPIYGSANTNLIGGVLRKATGKWIPEFFDQYLAKPLQITSYHMNLMTSGEAYMGGGLYMRPRDQLKIGQLYLNGGIWNGKRVVSKSWVDESLISHGILKPRMDIDTNHGYGYAWHFRTQKYQGKDLSYYWAGGNGGQLIIVIPKLDMVVGFTGGDYTEFQKYLKWEINLLPEFIIPAVK